MSKKTLETRALMCYYVSIKKYEQTRADRSVCLFCMQKGETRVQILPINRLETIVIGVEQDNIAHQVGIDMTDWLNENDRYTDFRVEVVNPDGYIYIAGNTVMVSNFLIWNITDSDTALPGRGKYQIVGMGEDGLRRTSYTAEIRIMRKIPGTASEETPDPAKPWTDKAQESALTAQEASISAENHMLEAQAAQEAAEAARDEAESHISTIKGYADDAAEAAGNADASAREAAGYVASTGQARDESVSARNEAVNAALQAEAAEIRARQQAESAGDEADRAAAAQTAAETARSGAETARDNARSARDTAQTAKDGAETAQEAAEAAQKRAEDAVDEIRTMTAEAVTLPPESVATAHYDSDSGKMTFGIPQGKNGHNGNDGRDTIVYSDDEPTDPDTSVWVDTSEKDGVEVPDMGDIDRLSESIMEISETVEGKADKNYVDSEFDNLEAQLIRDAMGISAQAYNRAMRNWFHNHGDNITTPEGITALCEEWYRLTRNNWCGWVTFSDPDISTVSEGVKGGDNAGLVCEPSTDTYTGRDDYAGLPLFAVTTVNWMLDADGNILITAIKGIHDTYEQDNPEKFVGVMQMSAWTFQRKDSVSYTYGYCSRPNDIDECKPLPESVKLDGTIREFVLHSKYMSTTVDGKMTSCSGLVPTRNNSHNTLITLPNSIGTQYSAGTSVDWSFIVWMAFIKYGSMTQDAKNQGCVSYNYQYYAKLSENGVNRIALTRAEATNIEIGSTVLLGAYAGNADRGQSSVGNISGINGRIVTAVENVVIDGNEYGLIYVDGAPFDTVANGNATTGSTILSTYHWRSGMNDSVLGNDGSIGSASNGRHPAMIQGIEYSVGGYEVLVDAILSIEGGYYVPYIAHIKQYQATSVTPNMTKVETLKSAQPISDAWKYIRKVEYSDGIFFAVDTDGEGNFVGSSAKYTRDGFYKNGTATVSALREWLAFGSLSHGSSIGGLCYLGGVTALSSASWSFLARLSPNGIRGEFMA